MADECRRIERIWKWFARTRSARLRQELIIYYRPLVEASAQRLNARLPQCVDVHDLASVGMFGLMDAIEAFDIHKGAKFETFSRFKIRGAMLDELRALDWAPRTVRKRAKLVAEIECRIQVETGRRATDEEVLARLDGPPGLKRAILRDGSPPAQVPLAGLCEDGASTQPPALIGLLADRRCPDPQRLADHKFVRDWILRGMSRSERLILILYYYEQLSMKEIGAVLGISESRVSQMHKSLIKQLRARLSSRASTAHEGEARGRHGRLAHERRERCGPAQATK